MAFCTAQTQDIGVWSGIKLTQQIDKKMSISLSQGVRFDDNISNVSNLYSQFKTKYEIVEGLKIGVSYRWAKKNRLE